MEITETYLQKAWGDSLDNITIQDIRTTISEIIQMDEEHGAFWVGIIEGEEKVLETHKDLTVIGVFSDNPKDEMRVKFKNWSEIENLYKIFLTKDFEKVKAILQDNKG